MRTRVKVKQIVVHVVDGKHIAVLQGARGSITVGVGDDAVKAVEAARAAIGTDGKAEQTAYSWISPAALPFMNGAVV